MYLTGISSIRDTEDIVAIEGRFLEALNLRRRRNRGIVHGKINQAKRAKGRINCEAPRMDPSEFYGTKAEPSAMSTARPRCRAQTSRSRQPSLTWQSFAPPATGQFT